MRIRTLITALLWFGVGAAVFSFGVLSPLGQRIENLVLSAAAYSTTPPPPLSLVSPLSIICTLLVLGAIALRAHGLARALLVMILPGFLIVASQLLKLEVFARPQLGAESIDNSFPSGHMTVFIALGCALLFALPRRILAIAAIAVAVLLSWVAHDLLLYGWHRPSDVIGGLALSVCGFAVLAIFLPKRGTAGVFLRIPVQLLLFFAGWITLLFSLPLAWHAYANGDALRLLFAAKLCCVAMSLLAVHTVLRLAALLKSPAAAR